VNDKVRSELVVPIEHDGKLLGVINLESYQPYHYDEVHEHFLSRVSTHIAEPLARLREHEREEYVERLAQKNFMTLYRRHYSTSQDFLYAALQQISENIKSLRITARVKEGERLALRAYRARPQDLFLPIGADELPKHERSLVGYVGHTKQIQRVGNVHQCDFFYNVDGQGKSALCAPILFDDNLLGTILLLHDKENFYTRCNELYLSSFMRHIAVPLYGLLERENYRTSPKLIRTTIKNTLDDAGTDDPFATPETSHAIAEQIARALRSRLCTIWLVNSAGKLTWHGVFRFPVAFSQ
jgi:putative methionine-R-sulfoxide reductase with GAF domain